MASSRSPGPTGLHGEVDDLNDGTLVRARSPHPGVIGRDDKASPRLTGDSARATAPAGATTRIAEDAALRNLAGKTKDFSFEDQTLRIIRADQWPEIQKDERYRIVAADEARKTVDRMAGSPTISLADKSALRDASALLPTTDVERFDGGLLLLRIKPLAPALDTSADSTELEPAPARPAEAKTEEKHWIEIEVVDADGVHVPGVAYSIVTSDKQDHPGATGADGLARLDGIVAGECTISLTRFDRDAWAAA